MSANRRSVGSMVFKIMMATGALYDYSKAKEVVSQFLAGGSPAPSPELMPAEQSGNAGLSFKGGAGVSNIIHLRGADMVSSGNAKIDEGKRLIRKGSTGPYDPNLISRGEALVREGKLLIQKGKALIEEAAAVAAKK